MARWNRVLKFGSGGVLGAAVGTAVAILWAPQSGDELKGRLADLRSRARLSGAQAKAETEDRLIRKFRDEVEDPAALRDEEAKVRVEAAAAVAAVGLGLNAPGALAAQETVLRADSSGHAGVAPIGGAAAPVVGTTGDGARIG